MSALPWVLAGLLAYNASTAGSADTPYRCSASEYHQFDFWLGDWDTFESGGNGPSIARAQVTRIAGGCAIHERYEQYDGLIGESILSFDAARKQWQQTWVTNKGSLMVISGQFKDEVLTMVGEVHLGDGKSVLQRITWRAVRGGVRESAVLSSDGGKSWAPAFDVTFRPRR